MFEQWKKHWAEELSKRGWWGRLDPPDPDDPEAVAKANLYVSRRLDTIWRVNTRQAYQAGVWERGQRSTSHPWVVYLLGPSREHREQHAKWAGTLLPRDDPFWSVANPSNGWGCKCTTRFVSRAARARYLRRGIPGVRGGKDGVKTEAPLLHPKQYRNPLTGKVHTGYHGISEGFERNPGVGRGEQIGEQYALKDDLLAKDTVPQGPRRVSDKVDNQLSRATARRARDTLSAIDLVHGTAKKALRQTSIVWDPTIPKKHRAHYDPNVPQIAFQGPTGDYKYRELVTAHELGHMIDHQGLPGAGYTSNRLALGGVVPAEFVAVFQAIQKAARWNDIRDAVAASKAGTEWGDYVRYLAKPEEWWARAYAQWVAWKSGSSVMKQEIDKLLASSRKGWRLISWGHDDFLPIAQAIDTLMESLGWLERQ